MGTSVQTLLAASPDISDDFGLTRFSMTNQMRDKLRDKIAPFVINSGVPLSPLNAPGMEQRRVAELKLIAESCFPAEMIAQMRQTVQGETVRPFVISNLPLDTWDDSKSKADKKVSNARTLMCDVIAEAIYAATGARFSYNERLFRRVRDHEKVREFKGSDIHTDGDDVTMLSTVINDEHASTKIIDLAAVLRKMPCALKQQIDIKLDSAEQAQFGLMEAYSTLNDLNPDLIAPYTSITVLRDECDARALAEFDRLVEEHSVDMDIQPGQLLCVNNRRIFHQGTRGALQPMHTDPAQITRVLTANLASL